MAITLDKFRAKLIIRILQAQSIEETERLVTTAINAMQKEKVNGYIIMRFADRVINQLRKRESLKTNTIQSINLMKAIFILQELKELISIPIPN